MAGAGGDEWIYVEEDAEVKQAADAVTAAAVGQENTMPSKNPYVDDGETAATAAEEEEKESNAADDDDKKAKSNADAAPDAKKASVVEKEYPYQYPDYSSMITLEEESETEKAYRAYVAAYQRAVETVNELVILQANRDAAKRAYMSADYYVFEEPEVEAASQAYLAAFRRAAEADDELQIQLASRDKAYRAYVAAFRRATYGGGSAAPASRGRLGSGHDNTCCSYNRYGHGLFVGTNDYGYGGFFGFPGATAYGHAATGHGYAALHPYGVHKTYVPSTLDRLFSHDGYTWRAGEPSPPAVAPTTTTTQPLDPYCSWE